ncbi:MAG: hypothetical protein A3F33_03775 [Candidatus Woykebacteria bacterium RIFCSPHIGHO2_12_FULL_43_10]|uniref:Leucine-rich repeat domain-containing protein n=2 Tax=Candidatus Woykeibacteriota TaxID=1817899 RepID=A0A1G1WUC7_9BACT|nr:MAG: hypothetical protein A2802_01185 [Candidatus Woykebacteria bacterium RIFCSPHIGHO2_01_FULL_43_29]OGY28981.1 MAG: hypothetical protein A3J50_03780 [Candidatus Woykebacteria bacterium RIFCSPHIGHO2_02_FULL_43_16b]OGY30360.1 MAG: hypothetical protein A3F33_03775 [Candidatus Woykebacteria bacterium RIFCSPHIGHO2_12_FULL_43_10]OGY31303.1 MAG: hypothetical protein A3A61_02840 [Candidatus Woykebacteria bacterium RIFCSPLOWO2_01_FULL_43_14]
MRTILKSLKSTVLVFVLFVLTISLVLSLNRSTQRTASSDTIYIPEKTTRLVLNLNEKRPAEPSIKELTSLEFLEIVGTDSDDTKSLATLLAEAETLPRLKTFGLTDFNSTEIPLELWTLKNSLNIEHLRLNSNGLQETPKEIFGFRNLRILDLSNNKIQTISAAETKLPFLKEVYLSHNELTEIPLDFLKNTSVSVLDLSSNKINNLPIQVSELASLRKLNLSDNQIPYLPDQVGKLDLEELNLRFNPLK